MASSDEQTAVRTNENTATTSTNDTPTVNVDCSAATTRTNDTPTVNVDSSPPTTNTNDMPTANTSTSSVVNEADVKPTSTDTTIANESGNTATESEPVNPPSAPIDVPVGNEITNATSVGQAQDQKTLTTDAYADDKSIGFQPLTVDDVNLDPPRTFDLPSTTDSGANNAKIDLNFSPPIDTAPPIATTVLPTTLSSASQAATAIVKKTPTIQIPQPNAMFSIGGDTPTATPSPSSPSPDIGLATDNKATTKSVGETTTTFATDPSPNIAASTSKTTPATNPKQLTSVALYVFGSPYKLLLYGIILAIAGKFYDDLSRTVQLFTMRIFSLFSSLRINYRLAVCRRLSNPLAYSTLPSGGRLDCTGCFLPTYYS